MTFDFECVMIVHDYKNVMGLSVPLVLASHGDTQERCNMTQLKICDGNGRHRPICYGELTHWSSQLGKVVVDGFYDDICPVCDVLDNMDRLTEELETVGQYCQKMTRA